jgi:hypothetical protein
VAGLAATPFLTALPAAAQAATTAISTDRFDPWLEIDAAALKKNVAVVSHLAHKRPILAVIKNNAYGLGLTTVASVLEPMPQIKGFAVVKAEAAVALRDDEPMSRASVRRGIPTVVSASINPGYTVSPVPSMTHAPGGTSTSVPTSLINPFRTTRVPLSRVAPETVTIFASVMA